VHVLPEFLDMEGHDVKVVSAIFVQGEFGNPIELDKVFRAISAAIQAKGYGEPSGGLHDRLVRVRATEAVASGEEIDVESVTREEPCSAADPEYARNLRVAEYERRQAGKRQIAVHEGGFDL
jgi:hypothetical protein